MISRWRGISLAALFVTLLRWARSSRNAHQEPQTTWRPIIPDNKSGKFQWANVPQHFPVTSMKALPTSISPQLPRIQHNFKQETITEKYIRLARLNAVKSNFTHAWKGYKDHAWLQDEVKPISGGSQDPFGGWAATLVDSLGQWKHNFVCITCH